MAMNYAKHFWSWGPDRGSIDVFRLSGGHEAERLLTVGSGHQDWRRLAEIGAQAICDRLDQMVAAEEDRV